MGKGRERMSDVGGGRSGKGGKTVRGRESREDKIRENRVDGRG